jgi:fucose 4-O-acetylase-like acetyltransferase
MKERLNYIDYMKTSGIYLIVLGHMFPCPGTNFIYSFSVPLFFFISGFLSYQNDSFNISLRKNFYSLIIPYLFINCISLIFVTFFTPSFSWEKSIIKPLLGVLIGANQGKMSVCPITRPTWFIYTLFILRISLYFIPYKKKMLFLTVLFCISIAIVLNRLELPNLALFNCFSVAPLFILGIFCRKNIHIIEMHARKSNRPLCIITTFSLLTLLSHYNGYVQCYAHNYGSNIILFYINAVLGIYMLFLVTAYFNNLSFKWNKTISQGTILILGFHYLFIIFLNEIYKTNNLGITMLYALFIIIIFIPIIQFIHNYFPWIIGKKANAN